MRGRRNSARGVSRASGERRGSDAAIAVLVPPAFGVFGGSFMHASEILAAIPALLLVHARCTGILRLLLLGALPILVAFRGGRRLREWTEALVRVGP